MSFEMKRLTDEIKANTAMIRQLMAQQSSGQSSYDQTVIPSDFSHKHMPSALQSGNLAAAINFTTRPTYNGADVIVDGDPVGLQADDDSTRLGVDADTAVTTGTKVLHTQLVGPTGITPAIRTLVTYNNPNLDELRALVTASLLFGRVSTTEVRELRSLISASDSSPNLDGIYSLCVHSLLSARKDVNTTIGITATDATYNPLHVRVTDGEELQTAGKYAVTMEIESIAASQDFIMIDKSDTTNFPHTTGTGTVHITVLDMEIDPDSSFVGDIELGFLENVDATNGDFHVMKEWHMDKRADIIEDFVNLIGDPFKCSSTYHLTNEISIDDTAFQTDVALSSPYDDAAAYTTVSGAGDIALRVTMSAGTADLSLVIKYYVA